MTTQDFIKNGELNSASQIFSFQSGCVVLGDSGVRAGAMLAGVDLDDIVRGIISKGDLEIILAHKPRAFTGKKWTVRSKERINNELKKWPPMPKVVFSLDDIQPILTERQRLRKLEPCYTYEYLRDYAHYSKRLSWVKADSYANYACCKCCYE